MAIAKLLHEGETIRQLKSVIKYNTVAKEHLNSADNPRLLQPFSNLGVIDIANAENYQDFMNCFIDEIALNQSLSKNKRQTKRYAHEVISFDDKDNIRLGEAKLAKISIELLSTLYDMQNTPYLVWPQKDSGRLHFHIVRSMYNSSGIYQRVKNSKRRMRQSCEDIERKYNLTHTGNNVSNEIRPANDPMAKVMKNGQLEAEYRHKKNLSKIKHQDALLTTLKRKSYDLVMENNYQSKEEIVEHIAYEQFQQKMAEKKQVNQRLEATKQTILNLYKSAADEADFIKQLEQQKITVEILKHAKSGKNKGIAFHYRGETISGGKISSSMTLGKIRNRFPSFIHTLEKPPSLSPKHTLQRKMLDFQIEQIDKYYKQRRNNKNGDILIYFGKKNVEARPYNYNLKLSKNRDLIRFGPSTPNHHDLSLSISIALQNGWKNATLTNSSPEFLKQMMKAAYQQNPELLFFVKPDRPHALSFADLKEIKDDLTVDELKIALKNKLIKEKDIKIVHFELIDKLKSKTDQPSEQGYALALENGFNIGVLNKKTSEELVFYHDNRTFDLELKKTSIEDKKNINTIEATRNETLLRLQKELALDATPPIVNLARETLKNKFKSP